MDPIAAFAVATVLLFFKMFLVALTQGVVRIRNRAFVNEDDARFFGKGATPRDQEHEYVARAQRTLRNDVENIPIALFLALAWILLGCWPEGLAWCLGAFVVARYLHSVFYLKPMQPYRNLAYSAGLLSTFAMAVVVAKEALARL